MKKRTYLDVLGLSCLPRKRIGLCGSQPLVGHTPGCRCGQRPRRYRPTRKHPVLPLPQTRDGVTKLNKWNPAVCRDRLGTAENRIRGLKRCFPKEPRPQYLWEQVKRAPGVTQDGMSPIARLFFVLVSMRSKHDLEREAKRHNSQTPLLH